MQAAAAAGNVLFALLFPRSARARARASSRERPSGAGGGGAGGRGGGGEFKLRKRQFIADRRTDKSRSNVVDISRPRYNTVKDRDIFRVKDTLDSSFSSVGGAETAKTTTTTSPRKTPRSSSPTKMKFKNLLNLSNRGNTVQRGKTARHILLRLLQYTSVGVL